MASFSPDWLALREPADHAARSAEAHPRDARRAAGDRPLRILDLGPAPDRTCGYYRPPVRRHPAYIEHGLASRRSRSGAARARAARSPASRRAAWICPRSTIAAIFDGRDAGHRVSTARSGIRALAARARRRCAQAGAAALFALSYDGRIVCSPRGSRRRNSLSLVNQHQRTDKGFGPALGPDAADVAARCFADLGYRVQRAPSDWTLTPDVRRASTAADRRLGAGRRRNRRRHGCRAIDAWRDRRLAHVAAGWSAIIVGHEDIAGWPL